jgi:hypothetical protein
VFAKFWYHRQAHRCVGSFVKISGVLCNCISYIVCTYRISYIHSDSLSTIYTATHITSNALAHCLGMLRIVPARLKLENLYTVLQSAKLPIHRVSRSEGSGYSGRRKDDIDVVAFQKILEAVAVHLHVPLDTLLRTSDSSFTNFCLPERREFRFSCADPEILKADLALSADTRSASPLSPHQHRGRGQLASKIAWLTDLRKISDLTN